MIKKIDLVLEALINNDVVGACRIAKDFKRDFSKDEAKTITRAFEMTWNPGFYEQLGFNAEKELEKAHKILLATYADRIVE